MGVASPVTDLPCTPSLERSHSHVQREVRPVGSDSHIGWLAVEEVKLLRPSRKYVRVTRQPCVEGAGPRLLCPDDQEVRLRIHPSGNCLEQPSLETTTVSCCCSDRFHRSRTIDDDVRPTWRLGALPIPDVIAIGPAPARATDRDWVACGDAIPGDATVDDPLGAVRRRGRGEHRRVVVVVGDGVVERAEHARNLQPSVGDRRGAAGTIEFLQRRRPHGPVAPGCPRVGVGDEAAFGGAG